ncbi:hypothetical protein [Burkholderia ambifaria]|uniref:hypothetical protein n=1 Tax=Burkholderia ambifaria TaxID=152480 RepID=UPI003D15F4E4
MRTDDPTMSICLVTLMIEVARLGPTARLCVRKYALSTWSVAVAFYPSVNILASIGLLADDGAASDAVESGVLSVE